MFQKVNGITLYYERMGEGRPIILLHGNGESHKIFDVLMNSLKEQYTVYAIDSRGHGQSTKVKELDYRTMAEDIVEFISTLKLEKPLLYGFSDGGILGMMIAAKYPTLLSKLIISGANVTPEGVKTSYLKLFQLLYFFTRSPKINLMITQPQMEDEELHQIIIPTLVLAGSKDLIKETHTRHMAEQIPYCAMQILPGESHESYVVHSEKLYKIIQPFLVGEGLA